MASPSLSSSSSSSLSSSPSSVSYAGLNGKLDASAGDSWDISFDVDSKVEIFANIATKEDLWTVPVPRQPLGSKATASVFEVGESVEYQSATHRRWIQAKVLRVIHDGLWDLDCKPAVPADKIRRPPFAELAYRAGSAVEYLSATQGKWIQARVFRVNPDGSYDLDCKPGALPARTRLPREREVLGTSRKLHVSERAEERSPPTGTVPGTEVIVLSSGVGTLADVSRSGMPAAYAVGDAVEYFGATLGKWIPAKVTRMSADGMYDLDCKPAVAPDRIRRPPRASYLAGAAVEYFSATHARWIPAKVVSVESNGLLDLDCKTGVGLDRVRRLEAPLASVSEAADYALRVGVAVEYFGATQSRWIPARVVKVNANGTYDLDCKIEVPPSRVRVPGARAARTLDVVVSADQLGPAAEAQPGTELQSRAPATARFGSSLDMGWSEPVQLLRARRSGRAWHYELCAEGAAMLERHASRRIAVVTVCGMRRSGKSFLLDMILERKHPGERYRAMSTEGLWLWGVLGSEERSPLLAFVDCEGFGGEAADDAHGARLMALCALLSSAVVMNTQGPLDDGVFDALAPVCRLDVNVEECGNQASRPELVWLLRDSLDCDDPADECLERALYAVAPGGRDAPQRPSAREVRKGLLNFFRHRSCAALAPPVELERLQQLDGLPDSALSTEFRAGLERLRSQLVASCLANPKAVSGQPLSCFSFVALLRQLTAAVNDDRILSIKGAWETVQHTLCGTLADELRVQTSKKLHALASGQQMPGGAWLPLTDDALYSVLRDQRRVLKAQWDESAIGEESVRREYWQELKETVAREETLVRVRNAWLADQHLMEALRSWREWLEVEAGDSTLSVSDICSQLGASMDRMPALPLSRASGAAIQAAARRVSAAHGAMVVTSEKQQRLQRDAVAFGERAAQQEGTVRSQLGAATAKLAERRVEADEQEAALARAQAELDAAEADLLDARAQLQQAVADIDASRARQHGLKGHLRTAATAEASLRLVLEQLQAGVNKTEAERLACERCAVVAGETATVERQRLEEELTQAKAEVAQYSQQLEEERRAIQGESRRTQQVHKQRVELVRRQLESEREVLRGEHEKERAEHLRLVAKARRQLEHERIANAGSLGDRQGKLLERDHHAGVLEGRHKALSNETESLRHWLQELEDQVREASATLGRQSHEIDRARSDLVEAQEETAKTRAEAERNLQEEREEYDQALEEARDMIEMSKRQPKCGCSVM